MSESGGWKNTVITSLIAALLACFGALWVLGVGEDSYFSDRKTLTALLDRLITDVSEHGHEIRIVRERVVVVETDLKEVKRRLDVIDRKF